ncbi:hypothetical protein ADUPG1_009997 [Aduncisulcus paluster]|uniref:Uncharacterized protein n=1 Tax=Aduncisulcus paluster TaxID=2918883 RepID=A0ABQ5L043_9EUKA|nr:hypothetical protein ADUPG1_009997 [Aduncisulcus paluster]
MSSTSLINPDVSAIEEYIDTRSLIPIEAQIVKIRGQLTHAETTLFHNVLVRQISDTFYRSLRSEMLRDKIEYGIPCVIPSIKTVHRLRKTVLESNRKCHFKLHDETVEFRWRSPISILPSFIFYNFEHFVHFSPYLSLPIFEESNPHCCSYLKYYQLYENTVKEMGLKPLPSLDREWSTIKHPTYDEYVALCQLNHLTPVFIVPILVFMDGVMTCRAGHTALTIRWTLANVKDDFKTKNCAWKEISILPEIGQIATSAFLHQLVKDATALQKGIEVVINSVTIRLYGTLFHIIADGKQVTDNIGTKHSSNDPCPWCDLTGIELLSADGIGGKRRFSSIATSRQTLTTINSQLPLWWGYRTGGLLFTPFRLHSADMLHVEDLGNSHDLARLLIRQG